MDCQQFRDAIDCYIDGELSAEATAAADAHRRNCSSCDRAAASLLNLKAGVRRAVVAAVVPPSLEARVRAVVPPRWSAHLRRTTVAAIAVAAVALFAVAMSAGGTPVGRVAANALDHLALLLDASSPVEIEGVVLCRDCELEHRYGVKATCDVIGHHGAIVDAAAGGRIWNIVEQSSSASLIHDESLLGRQIHLRGRLFRGAGAVVIESYELQGSVVARAN